MLSISPGVKVLQRKHNLEALLDRVLGRLYGDSFIQRVWNIEKYFENSFTDFVTGQITLTLSIMTHFFL